MPTSRRQPNQPGCCIEHEMSRSVRRATPTIPDWIRQFRHDGYVNAHSLTGLEAEPKLYCTETMLGDWSGHTLLLAKDAAPATVIRDRIQDGETNPWRHGTRADPMGYKTNEGVCKIAQRINGEKVYGSAMANLLREGNKTSGSLPGARSGELAKHLHRVLEFVVGEMDNLVAIVCLGADALRLVARCSGSREVRELKAGQTQACDLFDRRLLISRLHHPSRSFSGGWTARAREWDAVARRINAAIARS